MHRTKAEQDFLRERAKKKAVPEGTAKFREETSKKDSGRQRLAAARGNLGAPLRRCKGIFAVQQK